MFDLFSSLSPPEQRHGTDQDILSTSPDVTGTKFNTAQ